MHVAGRISCFCDIFILCFYLDESEEQIPLKNNDEINGVLDSKDVPNEEPELPKTKYVNITYQDILFTSSAYV